MFRPYVSIAVILALAVTAACGGGNSSSSSGGQQQPPPSQRSVTVNWVDTYWSPTGPVQVPAQSSQALSIEALVPQQDGSLTVLRSTATSPGVFTIANVPTGNYWLSVRNTAFWTNSSTFDAGTDYAGGQTPYTNTPSDTKFTFDVTGLTASPQEVLSFQTNPPTVGLEAIIPNASQWSGQFSVGGTFDWTQITNAFLAEYIGQSLGALDYYALAPELTFTNLSLVNGGTNPIAGTLNPAVNTSLPLSVSGSRWAPLFNNIGPTTANVTGSVLAISAEPSVMGVNVGPIPNPATVQLVAPVIGLFSLNSLCADVTGNGVLLPQPPVLTDQNFGALTYGDPFPGAWTRAMSFCQGATVAIPIPNSGNAYLFQIVDGENLPPSNSPLAPLAAPVQNATINQSSFFSSNTLGTTMPAISWSAPSAGASPYGYKVRVFVHTIARGQDIYQLFATYNTSGTSVTLPPLSGGNTYVFSITTEVDGAANMQSAPFRSTLPSAFASIVSAPITISTSAMSPQIRGDIDRWRELLQPISHERQTPKYACKIKMQSGIGYCD